MYNNTIFFHNIFYFFSLRREKISCQQRKVN